jgi:hypothetical protein
MEDIPKKVIEDLLDVFEASIKNVKQRMGNFVEYNPVDELNAICDIAVVILSAYRVLD